MRFASTRGGSVSASLGEALLDGLAPDGGLFVPEVLPRLPETVLNSLRDHDPLDLAVVVAQHLLGDDLTATELEPLVRGALDFPIPLQPVERAIGALELFWGPTLAFKDVGARFMAALMGHLRRDDDAELTMLVATSGDTGSAVAQAFHGREGFRVVVLFPQGRISEAQRKLFTTLEGNVTTYAVDGTFDDCQRLVKEAFGDAELRGARPLASANSINVGRLLPQTLFYFMGYVQTPPDAPALVCSTPSGNFGNLTAGLYAKHIGLPVDRFVAATNVNDVVPEYLSSGEFRPRPSLQTVANAMDVGNPSNFERIVHLYDDDLEALRADLAGNRYTDDEVLATIAEVDDLRGVLLDPHSAIGYAALRTALARRPQAYGMFLATAHPAKFPETVEKATGKPVELPTALAEPMAKADRSEPLPASYAAFRDALTAS
ncbi:MAG: threonine synthase [Acidobacteriota bacterium]|nr:threonine synthase [Acidobacteriota bacterium]